MEKTVSAEGSRVRAKANGGSAGALWGSAAAVVTTAVVVIVCALMVHHGCTHGPLGEARAPEPGTDRAGFCGTVDRGSFRWLTAVLPVVLVCAGVVTWRARARRWFAVAAAVVAVEVGLAALGTQLNAIPTI